MAGPVVLHHPPAAAWAVAAAAGGTDGDDDPAHPRRRLKSAHEADLEPIRGSGRLTFACEPCRLAFASEESVKAHHGNRSDVFLTMRVDPRYQHILVETLTLAQAAAIVRAARRCRGP